MVLYRHRKEKGVCTTKDTPQRRWDKANIVQINIKLFPKADADILSRLETVESKAAFAKKALRAYIKSEEKAERHPSRAIRPEP